MSSHFGRPEPTDLETSLLKFFRAQTTKARRLKSACDELRVKLTRDDAENDAQEVPESALKQLNSTDMSAYFNGGVFNALQLISKCNPESHENAVEDVWHPTRLCLDETEVGIRVFASFATETGDWQEFCVRTCANLSVQCSFYYANNIGIRSSQPGSPSDDHWTLLEQGGFCNFLEREITARVFLSFIEGRGFRILGEPQQLLQMLQAGRGESLATVLRKYDLKPKDKVLLASAIARAYWQ